MKRQNVAAMARANGVNPQTAHNRIMKGWTTEAATSTPARKYNRPKPKPKFAHGGKAEAVWAYLIANPLARPADVSKATGVSYGYVHQLMGKVGTPREVFEAEAKAKQESFAENSSPFPPRKILIGAAIVAVVAAWVASSYWL